MKSGVTNNQTAAAQKRQFTGEVTSVVENKTIHVVIQLRKLHPVYRKQYWQSKKYAVHDERNEAKVGDTVVFEECHPLSKTKRWRLLSITKKSV
ncbi:MAG: 30S ribosomal protein S17 [Candidatus Magasanikbacteria bacterium RIFCSPHIGHO2_02_FULL_47_14]|uniref:Small ribosomal subunit protein uS17 n=1 Tax=Candidatus Magasanikbacteria bacterium RIFCSPHIGHO2_02_FULL_47_14 TaxID=1798680 RepID=A0A1F6LYQ6_9BACT|nr:MAG: 30S ribosomal protein S17 [Candidatus Magasanikbacteria bacterium RIFCSPHIGHO2_02_FULL_47_14]